MYENLKHFKLIDGELFPITNCYVSGRSYIPCSMFCRHAGKYTTNSVDPNVDVAQHVRGAHVKFGQMAYGALGNPAIALNAREKLSPIAVAKMVASANTWYKLSETGLKFSDSFFKKKYI